MSAGYEFDTSRIRFIYSSMTTPAETYDYDMATRERTLRKRQEVPSGHNPADYVTRRLFAPAPGRRARADHAALQEDDAARRLGAASSSTATAPTASPCRRHSRPAGCRSSIAASSTPSRTSAAARTRAIAGTPTARWRRRRTPSPTSSPPANTSSREGFTKRGRIVANGGSAGGMLMGAVANMAPDLFAAIIADVPFVDVLNTMLDKDLPLTPPEWPEWGNPLANKDEFEIIRSYSPYDNVEAQGLSAHPGARRAHRSARHLLGTGEVDRQAARAEHQRQPGASENQHGRRTRRRLRPLRRAEGHRAQFRVRAEGGGVGLSGSWCAHTRLILELVPRIYSRKRRSSLNASDPRHEAEDDSCGKSRLLPPKTKRPAGWRAFRFREAALGCVGA